MNVNHAFVFDESLVVVSGIDRHALGVDAQDGLVQPSQFVSPMGKRDLRNQQNDEDDDDDGLLFN